MYNLIRNFRMAEVVGFPGFPMLTCKPGDPLTGRITYLNHTLASGSTHYIGYFPGDLKADRFHVIVIEFEGVRYWYGSLASFATVAPGSEGTVDVLSRAIEVTGIWDALTWVGKLTAATRVLYWDDRIIGIDERDIGYIRLYHRKVFEDVLQIIYGAEVKGLKFLLG